MKLLKEYKIEICTPIENCDKYVKTYFDYNLNVIYPLGNDDGEFVSKRAKKWLYYESLITCDAEGVVKISKYIFSIGVFILSLAFY